MSSMRNLKIVILTPDPERFRGALTLAAAQAALGASVSIFLQLEAVAPLRRPYGAPGDSKSEEHTSELQSLMRISYAVFCLQTNNNGHPSTTPNEATLKHLIRIQFSQTASTTSTHL